LGYAHLFAEKLCFSGQQVLFYAATPPLFRTRLQDRPLKTMHDFKNITLAWMSSSTAFFAAIEAGTVITLLSAIVLPIIFFAAGKTIDVLLQIYFRRREDGRERDQRSEQTDSSGRCSGQ
jgi:hypothetical protein